ncbi:MAG: two-component regulator propeller domain-containing protein [Flavobacteriales bacterium]
MPFFLSILFLFASTQCATQSVLAPSVIQNGLRISNSEGLSQGFIHFIFQDSFGFIWLSTIDGLNRYNGYEFKTFRNNPEDSNSIGSNESCDILEDRHTNVWLNTINKGVECYIRELEVFVHFNVGEGQDRAISDNQIYWMALHGDDEIWICTEKGIDVIQFQKTEGGFQNEANLTIEERIGKTYTFRIRHYPRGNDVSLKTLHAQLFGKDRMIGIYNGAPYIIRLKDTLELEPLSSSAPEFQRYVNSGLKTIIADSDRKLLYLFYTDYILIWDEINSDIRQIPNEFPSKMIPKQSGHLDRDGNIWKVQLDTLYCLKYNSTRLVKHCLSDSNSPVNSGYDGIAFLIDRSGLWWIGTPGYGVFKYNPNIELFHHSRSVDNSGRSFYSIALGSDSTAYLMGGTHVWQFDLIQQRLTKSLPATGFEPNSTEGLLDGHAMLQDSSGNIWMAFGSYLFFLDYNEKKSELVYTESEYGLTCLTPIYESHDKSIWFGSATKLIHFNSSNSDPETFVLPYKFNSLHEAPFINSIVENGDYMWLATVAGVFGFHKSTHEWITITPIPGDINSISPYRVYALIPDPFYPENYLWAGLNGGGICRINLKTFEVKKFTSRDGLPNDVVYGILADDKGRLWISGNSGISCLQPSYNDQQTWLQVVRNFTTEDGLQSNEFNRHSYFKTPDGLMLFGGVNGINSFYPEEALMSNNPPNIAITDIRIRNKSLQFGNPGDDIPMSPTVLTELVLQPDQDMLTIQYAALEFTNSRKNKFKYQLIGLSEEWIEAGFNREANFTKLDPGEYVFTVIGSDSEGVWNTTGRSMKIIVLPAWWQTWWFRILVVLLIASIVMVIYKYRINQLKKIQSVRDGIARDLHDEIGSTLSSISLYSDLVKERTETDLPDISPIAAKISESSHRLMDSMSDIVWAINPDNDELNDVVQRMRAVAAELTEAAGIQLEFVVDKNPEHIRLNMESRRNFYLIFREALNNAIKYAESNRITIRMVHESDGYLFEISDDGQGFDVANHKRGNGLLNMQKRASFLKGQLDIQSSSGKGTVIRLKFKA